MSPACLHKLRDRFEDINKLISARQIRPAVDKVLAFEQAQGASRYAHLASQEHVGKIVIRVLKD